MARRRNLILGIAGIISMAVIWANLSILKDAVRRSVSVTSYPAEKLHTNRNINRIVPQEGDNLLNTEQLKPPDPSGIDSLENDVRCRSRHWGDVTTFPTLGVVVTFGDHESVYNIIHTVHALVERTPAQVLKEIVIVDDNSTKDEHKELMSNYLRLAFGELISIHRSVEPLGLIRARKTGGMLVTADVIAFFDSHQEVQPGWAEPLLLEIRRNPRVLVAGHLDWMEKKGSRWEYIHGPISWVTVFDWNFDFQFQDINTEKLFERKDPTESFQSPMMIGNTYAIRREYFHEIGTFDEGMEFWGGENIDLSLRAWMCGGQVRVSPCSRASHLEGGNLRGYRDHHKDYATYNYKRVAEVWLDQYKKLFYKFKPEAINIDAGDLSERRQLRKKCPHNFDWYLKNGFPYLGVPARDGIGYDGLKNKKYGGCLDTLQSRIVGMWDQCDLQSHGQGFFWDRNLNLRFPLHIFNMDELRDVERTDKGLRFSEYLVYHNTSWKRSNFIHWKDGPFIEVDSMQCLEAITNKMVGFRECRDIDAQKWSFNKYSSAYKELVTGADSLKEQYKIYIKVFEDYRKFISPRSQKIRIDPTSAAYIYTNRVRVKETKHLMNLNRSAKH